MLVTSNRDVVYLTIHQVDGLLCPPCGIFCVACDIELHIDRLSTTGTLTQQQAVQVQASTKRTVRDE